MANTPIEAVYVATKTNFEPTVQVRYPYVYDGSALPYIYMYEADDPRNKMFLCDDKGGEARITIGYMSDSFNDCVDYLETIIDYVKSLIGSYSPIKINFVTISSVRDLTGLEQAETMVYRREFDAIVKWGKA